MLHSYPALPPAPPQEMCRLAFSPQRKSRIDHHARHGSDTLPRTRPINISSQPSLQHAKRASMYISDASIILAQRTPMVSPVSHDSLLLLSPSNDAPDSIVIDHYAILELDFQAPTDDVKAAYRRLRGVYFQSDAKKYRALQAAFDTLMDPEARQAYDANYASTPSLFGEGEPSKHERKDSGLGDAAGMPAVFEEEEEEEEEEEDDDDAEVQRSEDPNWALKRNRRLYEPLIGTQPYHSFVPMSMAYSDCSRSPSTSQRPMYVGRFATMSRPT